MCATVILLSQNSPTTSQADEHLGPVQVAIVVGGDVRDEVGGMVGANGAISNFDFHRFLP